MANLFDLCLDLQPKSQQFIKLVNDAIVPSTCRITVTYRDAAAQNSAKACHLSNAAAGQSPHNCVNADGLPASRAFDYAIINPDGSYCKDGTDNRYTIAGRIAEGLGLAWGIHFPKPDFDHCEVKDWRKV